MCGIIGYTGTQAARDVLVKGLQRLEYRGYDSAGIAISGPDHLECVKVRGCVADLAKRALPGGHAGIGHTRWATHGAPTERNAHPHLGCTEDFALVHNGIIENHGVLRARLEKAGHTFHSDTDTEVLVHLVEEAYAGDLVKAVRTALAEVDGSYAVAVVSRDTPGEMVAARRKSPLLVGLAEDGHILASDATAVLGTTNRVIYLEDGEIAHLTPHNLDVYGPNGVPRVAEVNELQWSVEGAEKGGFDHFMLKEIHEIPRALRDSLDGRLPHVGTDLALDGGITADDFRSAKRILVLACGTSYHAGLVARPFLENLTGLPVTVQQASEYRYGPRVREPDTLTICVSQSGETADTLEAMRLARERGDRTLAVTNVVGSTLARETDGTFYLLCGPEVSVAATKTFVNTLLAFYLLAAHTARVRGQAVAEEVLDALDDLPRAAAEALESAATVRRIADRYVSHAPYSLFIGRQAAFGLALEGALKVKEIAYIPSEGYPAGELKHGPLALLEPGVPTIACVEPGDTYPVMLSNLQEARARGSEILALVDETDTDVEAHVDGLLRVPHVNPAFFAVPAALQLHLLSYYAAKARGCAIDKPRNLAKSVTVE